MVAKKLIPWSAGLRRVLPFNALVDEAARVARALGLTLDQVVDQANRDIQL
jgi:hypothetical protein